MSDEELRREQRRAELGVPSLRRQATLTHLAAALAALHADLEPYSTTASAWVRPGPQPPKQFTVETALMLRQAFVQIRRFGSPKSYQPMPGLMRSNNYRDPGADRPYDMRVSSSRAKGRSRRRCRKS